VTQQHTHELDDKLHEDCPMCQRIIALRPVTKKAESIDKTVEHYAEIADRPKKTRKHKKAVEDALAGATVEFNERDDG